MKIVGIKLLKDKLSEYVRLAAGGETVLVTDRNEVVAELGPPRADRSQVVSDAVIAEDIRRGLATPPHRRGPLTFRRPAIATTEEIVREVREDRDGR